jgi:hypothetical protein
LRCAAITAAISAMVMPAALLRLVLVALLLAMVRMIGLGPGR